MIAGVIPLVSKVVIFGLDLLVRNKLRRDKIKAEFEAFVAKFDHDAKKSTDLHTDCRKMKEEIHGGRKEGREGN